MNLCRLCHQQQLVMNLYYYLFRMDCPKQVLVSFGSLIMTSRNAIQGRGKLFWIKLRGYVAHAEKSFEVAVMEKLWSLVFYPDLFLAEFDQTMHPTFMPPNPNGINLTEQTLFIPWKVIYKGIRKR